MKKLVLTVLGLLALIIPVFANSMAPTSIPGKSGIFVDKASGIELIHETIEISIDDELEKTHYRVHYTFRNGYHERIEKPIWFLATGYWNSDDFKVSIDNVDVKSNSLDVEFNDIENWDPEEKLQYIDPFTDEVFDSGMDRYSSGLFLAEEFILEMDSGQISEVVIEYQEWNGYISPRITDYIRDVKLTSYMLSPAAFYEGDGLVDISITAPSNTILRSNLELVKKEAGLYVIHDYQLREDENLYLSFSKKPGITELFAHDRNGFKVRLLLIQVLLLIGIMMVKSPLYKKRLKWILLISMLAYMRTAGYGGLFLIAILYRVLGIPILITGAIILSVRFKRKGHRLN